MHRLLVGREGLDGKRRVGIGSDHWNMRDVVACRVCRRAMDAGFPVFGADETGERLRTHDGGLGVVLWEPSGKPQAVEIENWNARAEG